MRAKYGPFLIPNSSQQSLRPPADIRRSRRALGAAPGARRSYRRSREKAPTTTTTPRGAVTDPDEPRDRFSIEFPASSSFFSFRRHSSFIPALLSPPSSAAAALEPQSPATRHAAENATSIRQTELLSSSTALTARGMKYHRVGRATFDADRQQPSAD